MPTITQAIRTTTVPWISCGWAGHSTFLSSAQDSLTNCAPRERRPRAGAAELPAREAAPWASRGTVLGAGGRDGRAHRGSRAGAALDCGFALGLGRAAGAALGAGLPGHRLAGLPVRRVPAAPAAVFLELDA